MKILLDTHALIWFIEDAPDLAPNARTLIAAGTSQRLVSIASLWEMAIKATLNKLDLPLPYEEFVTIHVPANKIQILPISVPQLVRLTTLGAAIATEIFTSADVEDAPLLSVAIAFKA